MSEHASLPLAGETFWPPHSENCFTIVNDMCQECYFLLAPVPLSLRRQWWHKYHCRQHKIPDPLPDTFMDRLRATLAASPEKYAPLFRQLANYEGDQ